MRRVPAPLAAAGGSAAAATLLAAEGWLAARSRPEDVEGPILRKMTLSAGGEPLRYLVLGDSTAAGRGCQVGRGVAVPTAERLAGRHSVTLHNLARSGARVADVLREQAPQARGLEPDVVLVSVGGNDAMHFTPLRVLRRQLDALLALLLDLPPRPAAVVSSAPEMGSIPRFGQPLRRLIGWRGRRVSRELEAAADRHGAHYAPLDRTEGPRFYRERSLFAADRIHPSGHGYAVLAAALGPMLDAAVTEPSKGPPGHTRSNTDSRPPGLTRRSPPTSRGSGR